MALMKKSAANKVAQEEALAKQEYVRLYGRVPSEHELLAWLQERLREFHEARGRIVRDVDELLTWSRQTVREPVPGVDRVGQRCRKS